jgi:hypothetical protein
MGVATGISLALSAAALGYGVYSGENAATAQRGARRRQDEAQREALRVQLAERARSVQAEQRADRPSPASTISLGEQLLASGSGASSLTTGVDDRLRLQKSSKLGGGA